MNDSITHIITALPKHCIGQNGAIRKDLLKPAPFALRENCSLKEPEEPIDIVTYTIQSGDNLSVIAEKFGTTVDRLVELNGIENPNLIYAGDVLRIN